MPQTLISRTWILLLALASLGLSQGAPEATCAVTGSVTAAQSNLKIQLAILELTPVHQHPDIPLSVKGADGTALPKQSGIKYKTVSGPDGTFCFTSVEAGQYVLSAKKIGFLDTNYGTIHPSQLSIILDVEAGQRADLPVRLFPQSVISGKVTTRDGEPLDAGTVQLVSTMWIAGQPRKTVVRGVTPNDLGEYRIAGLQPGTYWVRFHPRDPDATTSNVMDSTESVGRLVPSYHPSTMTMRQALPIELGVGEHASGKDILVRHAKTYAVEGKLLATGSRPEFSSINLVSEGEEPAAIVVGNALGPDGAFRLPSVPPGAYTLIYLAGAAQAASVGRTTVDVMDHDVSNLVIDAPPPVTVNGTILVDGDSAAKFTNMTVRITSVDAAVGPSYTAPVQGDGSFVRTRTVDANSANLGVTRQIIRAVLLPLLS